MIALLLSASPNHSNFMLGTVDVHIRYGVPDWPNLVSESVFEEPVLPLASPGLHTELRIGKLAAPYIASGRLLPIFDPAWSLLVRAHFIVYPERHAQRPEVVEFVSWLRKQVAHDD